MRHAVLAVLAVAMLAGAAAVWAARFPAAGALVPTAPVREGSVEVVVRTTGEIRASRTTQVTAPPAGGSLTIVALAPTGAALEAGEVIVEFDAADQVFALEQAQYDLALADQEIARADAQAAAQVAADDVALLRARYAVRRAELDASGNEFVSTLVARQNLLLLEEARQALAQLERDIASRRETTRAAGDALHERRNKARLAVTVAERNIQSLKITAPFAGHVIVRPNLMAMGGFIFAGAVLPEYRVGDSSFPGQLIADLVDTSVLEVAAKLSERDRAAVEAGQAVSVVVDGMPATAIEGTVRSVSDVASRRAFESGGTRQFDVALDISGAPQRLWPGASVHITIAGATLDNVRSVPRAAVFDVAGTPTVYVRRPGGFDARGVQVRAWTESVAVSDELDPLWHVALVDPTKVGPDRKGAPPAPASPVTGAAP